MGSQCQTDTNVVVTEGPKATALAKQKDDQIAGLVAQVKDEQSARQAERLLASQAASGVKGIIKATEYMPDSPPKEAAQDEAKLALSRLPPDDPAETVKALERVVLIVTGQRDEALKRYTLADAATKTALDQIAAKNADIAARDKTIIDREQDIAKLKDEATVEQAAHIDDVKKAIAAKNIEIQHIKDEEASKERRWWITTLRLTGLGCILAGIALIAFLKAIPQGAIFIVSGVVIGLAAIGIDMLTAMWWFPYACGLIGLLILGGGVWAAWHAYRTNTLHTKLTGALQDLKDESTTLKNDTWNKVVEHLQYRLGDSESFWAKQQNQLVGALGLVNIKQESTSKDNENAPKT